MKPNAHNLRDMIKLVDWTLSENLPVLQLMLHSSEFMPGGSPIFREKDDIERLYDDLNRFLSHVSSRLIEGATFAEYRQTCKAPV
jgi:hypothetical protein